MGDVPRRGVVDADCRVHGIAKFPTVGAANPTVTMRALALRPADHLRGALGGRPPAAAEPEAAPAS